MIWESASKIKSYIQCPRASRVKQETTDPMRAGSLRHFLVEYGYVSNSLDLTRHTLAEVAKAFPEYSLLPPEMVEEAIDVVAAWYERKGWLPAIDTVLSVEARDLPPKYSYELKINGKFIRTMFRVPVVDGEWGLQGGADIVCLHPDNQDSLLIVDHKGRTQEDDEIQGVCYALAYSKIFPGYSRYDFHTHHVGSWTPVKYEYPVKYLPQLADNLTSIVRKKRADTVFEPKANRWCDSCSIKGDCPVYIQETTVPIAETAKAAKAEPAPDDDEALVALYKRVATTRKIAEAREESLKAELKRRIEERGEVIADSRRYTLKDKAHSYKLVDELAEKFCDRVGIHPSEVLSLDRGKLQVAWETVRARVSEDQLPALDTAYRDLLVPLTHKEITSAPLKAGKVDED